VSPTMSPLHYFPHPPQVLLIVALIVALLGLVLRFVLVDYAYERLGLSRRAAWLVLWASLLGSAINVPVAALRAQHIVPATLMEAHGLLYVIPPIIKRDHTIVAVNIGGAVIPLLLVAYLLIRFGVSWRMIAAVALVTVVVHSLAHPVRGVGIALPSALIPGLLAGGAAVVLDPWTAPRTAFIAGTVGTLLGADLLNLGVFADLGAPVVSIGGAGTFDGIFVTGILAVLLAGLSLGKPSPKPGAPNRDTPTTHDAKPPHDAAHRA
jgi:uncharacterized membrane protein